MSNPISRRTFLKCTGASAVALGAAGLLGGCKQNGGDTIVDVKVGDKVGNWNGLGVQLTSLFNIDTDGQSVECGANISLYNSNSQTFSESTNLPPQGSGYLQLMLMVPKGWQNLQITYMPTFVADKTITFNMTAADMTRA